MKRIFHILFSIFLLVPVWNCARTGSISGGPRDKTPPRVVKSKPLNGAINFNGKEVKITFNEYINDQDIREELVISPPFKERTETRMMGKSLIIELQDTLKENTTYTLSFGQSIKDLNEGNVLENYEFIFSTGNYLDSMAVGGTVLRAFDLEPLEEEVKVMLYTNLNDSAPYLDVPDYVCKATPTGEFLINNMKPGNYRLFALQDQNQNLKYDTPEEQIGFLDTLIRISPDLFDYAPPIEKKYSGESVPGPFISEDSVDFSTKDTLADLPEDSLTIFDLARYLVMVEVFAFQEDNRPQYLIDNKREDRRKLTLLFNREVRDTVILEPLNFSPRKKWFLFEPHVMRDTLTYWITDSLVYGLDSLEIIARYRITDTLMQYTDFTDTLSFIYREPEPATRRRRREAEAEQEEKISLSLNRRGTGPFDIYKDLTVTAGHPCGKVDTSRIRFTFREDTVDIPAVYSVERDSFFIRTYRFQTKWKEGYRYDLRLYPGAITDIYDITHDTLSVNFQTRHTDYYGTIQLKIRGPDTTTIVQVIDNKGNVIKQSSIERSGTIEFLYLEPDRYRIKRIRDVNGNGKWDTGNYLKGIQPETVSFRKEKVNVRSNFHYEINWNISQ